MFDVVHVSQLRLATANGVHRSMWGMARSQAELGLKVLIVSIGSPPSDADLATTQEHGVSVRILSQVRSSTVKEALGHEPRDHTIIHTHGAFDPPITFFSNIATKQGYKVIRTPHGSLDAGVFARRAIRKVVYWHLLERASFDRTALVHLVGPSEEATLAKYSIKAPRRLIPNGVFPEDIDPVRRIGAPSKSLLYIGRFDLEQKALDVMLPAAAAVPEIRLTLVGNDYAGGRAWIEGELDRLDVGDRIVVLDPVFDVATKRRLMESHDAFVHLSRWEGMPNACLEAASGGMPLVVTPGTNLVEKVRSASAGWAVADTSVEAATTAFREFARQVDTAEQRGRNAAEMIREHFLWPRLAADFAAVYDELRAGSDET